MGPIRLRGLLPTPPTSAHSPFFLKDTPPPPIHVQGSKSREGVTFSPQRGESGGTRQNCDNFQNFPNFEIPQGGPE